MRKGLATLVLVIFAGLVYLTMRPLQATEIPDVIKIFDESFKDHKKGPVTFTHERHSQEYKVACTECHHNYQDGNNVWKEGDPVKKCSSCHDPEKKQGNADKLNLAFHKNCHGCHKELKGKQGPWKKCNDCHEKK
jgi:hypothetical protein